MGPAVLDRTTRGRKISVCPGRIGNGLIVVGENRQAEAVVSVVGQLHYGVSSEIRRCTEKNQFWMYGHLLSGGM